MASMALLQLHQTEAEVRQKAQKAFRELAEAEVARQTAQEMATLRVEAEKKAGGPAAMMAAAKARMLADVDFVKADLAFREAYVQQMSLVGQPQPASYRTGFSCGPEILPSGIHPRTDVPGQVEVHFIPVTLSYSAGTRMSLFAHVQVRRR